VVLLLCFPLSGVVIWSSKKLDEGIRIGVDPTLIRAGQSFAKKLFPLSEIDLVDAKSLKESLGARKSSLVSLKENLVDIVWAESRPPRPKSKVFQLGVKYSGSFYFYSLVSLRLVLSRIKDSPRVTRSPSSEKR
jgi:Xaa-Pro aminopeptidase